jgi:hypothetical protein
MAEDSGDQRFHGGPRLLGALLPKLTRPVLKKRAPATAALLADWGQIMGPALAAVTVPQRLTGTTLTIGCAGPVAMELAHLAPQVMERINQHLGRQAVGQLKFVQAVIPGRPAPARRLRPAAKALPAAVAAELGGVGDEALRAALAKLGAGVYRDRD